MSVCTCRSKMAPATISSNASGWAPPSLRILLLLPANAILPTQPTAAPGHSLPHTTNNPHLRPPSQPAATRGEGTSTRKGADELVQPTLCACCVETASRTGPNLPRQRHARRAQRPQDTWPSTRQPCARRLAAQHPPAPAPEQCHATRPTRHCTIDSCRQQLAPPLLCCSPCACRAAARRQACEESHVGGRRELTSSLRLTTSAAYILGKTVSTARDPAAVPAHAGGLAMRRL